MAAMWLASCSVVPEPLDLRTFDKPEASNHFLVCDPALCRAVPDLAAPRFRSSPERLGEALRQALRDEPRLTQVSDEAGERRIYVQRSAVFRFPDVIWVQTIAWPEGGSSLALYSRSVHGRYDFGVNEARLRRWLAKIEAAMDGAAESAAAGGGLNGPGSD